MIISDRCLRDFYTDHCYFCLSLAASSYPGQIYRPNEIVVRWFPSFVCNSSGEQMNWSSGVCPGSPLIVLPLAFSYRTWCPPTDMVSFCYQASSSASGPASLHRVSSRKDKWLGAGRETSNRHWSWISKIPFAVSMPLKQSHILANPQYNTCFGLHRVWRKTIVVFFQVYSTYRQPIDHEKVG